jgi:hypothetical protein
MKPFITLSFLIFVVTNTFCQQQFGSVFYSQNFNRYKYSYYSSVNDNGNNFSAGGKFNVYFNKFFGVESGMAVTKISYKANYPTGLNGNPIYPLSSTIDAMYAEVPLSLSFQKLFTEKFRVFISIGVTKSIHLYSDEITLFSDSIERPENFLTCDTGFSQIAGGIAYYIREKFGLRFDTQLRNYLSDFRLNTYTLALSFGLEYKI